MRAFRLVVATTLVLTVVACGAPPTPPGALNLAIAGLPADIAADVTVTGPGGFQQVVMASASLTSLTPGTYAIAAAVVDDAHPIVPALFDPVAGLGSIDVASGSTVDAAVTYAHRTLTGTLWISSGSPSTDVLRGFLAAQLEEDGAPTPEFVVGGGSDIEYTGVAFDAAGNAWVASYSPQRLYRFAVADLATAAGSATPDVEIVPSVAGSVDIAFDDEGALWVTANGALLKYAPGQLAIGGTPTPQVTITSDGTSLSGARGLAFDRDGNLWVVSMFSAAVERFAAAQLLASGNPTPSVTLSASPGVLDDPYGIAFDANGAMWVSSLSNGRILRFDANQLAASGPVAPAAVITGVARPLVLAFDHSGALWATSKDIAMPPSVVRLVDPSSYTGTSAAEIDVTIDLDAIVGGYPTFFPPPGDVPLRLP